MTSKTAAELQAGDVFCREGRPDARYRVRSVQAVPIYGWYGNVFDTIQVTVEHHLTGLAHISLSPDELVSVLPAEDFSVSYPSAQKPGWFRRRRA